MGTVELGQRLRSLRTERGLSLSQMEARTGISKSFLGLVEQGRSDISITRLLKLARAYDVTLDELADAPSAPRQSAVVRAGQAPVIHADTTDVAVLLRHREAGLTASVLSYRAGTELVVEQTSFGEAILYVLEGRFSVRVADGPDTGLDPGDMLVYRGPVSITIRCAEGEPARVLSVAAGVLTRAGGTG